MCHYRISAISTLVVALLVAPLLGEPKKWQKGEGWGWVWGPDDEIGALNEMSPKSILEAVALVKKGQVSDLGILYDRSSYKWGGHSPGEIMTFRSPEGVNRQQNLKEFLANGGNTLLTGWHNCALFISDNVATQIDGLEQLPRLH